MLAVEVEGYRIESECPAQNDVRLFRARQIIADTPVLLQLWQGPAESARSAIRALAGLRHPGLATVLDVGETHQAQAYAALAALPGESLAELLRRGLDLDQSLALLRRLALVLQFVESRAARSPCLDPETVFTDAHGRPVLTRLLASDDRRVAADAMVRLLHLFYEALTGHAPDLASPTLPDYLRRWQPLFDLPGGPTPLSPQQLLRALDALEGRAPAAETRPGDATTLRGKTVSDTASPPGADGPTEAASAQQPEPRALPPSPPVAPDERVTAPARRLDKAAARAVPELRALGEVAQPAPPSRIPLLLAAVLALPLLAGLAWWMLFSSGGSASEIPQAAATARPALPSPTPPPRLDPAKAVGAVPMPADIERDLVDTWQPQLQGELDLQTLPTVEDPLERLLSQARTNLQAGRWIAPPGRNTLDRYLQALRIEPGNSAARAGIAELGERCLARARAAEGIDEQLQALDCAERVAAAHEAGAKAAKGATDVRQSEHDRYVQAGGEALADWRSAEASARFADALRMLPASPAATAGLAESERQGRPGYRFRDTLSGGGVGPELVVVDGMAWGRSEVTVAEFRAYWVSAGRARFGAEPPPCRDRESMLRSSRRRDWSAPGFEQTDAHPVACVSFGMAQHYVEWLSAQSGHPYRLPRRSEWQALAGLAPTDCRANFRDRAAAEAWNAREASSCSDGHAYTAAVAAAGETRGLLGLWGNLAEWLEDCEGGNCRQRLAAGGSWFSAAAPADRGFAVEPGFTTIGVRIVRAIPARD